jgi:hypothetical protein
MEAIKMLLYKHPVYAMCIFCLALYGLSMLCFVARDTGETEPWIDKNERKDSRISQEERVKAVPKKEKPAPAERKPAEAPKEKKAPVEAVKEPAKTKKAAKPARDAGPPPEPVGKPEDVPEKPEPEKTMTAA